LDDSSKSKKLTAAKRTQLATDLYTRYPRKVAKAEALKAIDKAIVAISKRDFAGDEKAATDWLGIRVDLYARSPQANQPDKSKIPYFATWLNSGRFDDDPAEWNYVVGAGKGASRGCEQIDAGQDHGFEEVLSRPEPEWVKAAAR
jgi:hypothetical protein